jgi:hypothetical protein
MRRLLSTLYQSNYKTSNYKTSNYKTNTMALLNQFTSFDELHDALKLNIARNIKDSKTFLSLIAASKCHGLSKKYIHERLNKHQQKDYNRLIEILFVFTTDCLDIENKFLNNEDVRNKHLELFLNGYAQDKLLEDDSNFTEYNNTFENMVNEIACSMVDPQEFFRSERINDLYTEIINRLRLRNELKDNAKQVLFKQMEDDSVEHILHIEFESGVKISISISISKPSDADASWIDIEANFTDTRNDKQYKNKYVISEENEEFDVEADEDDVPAERWINNDPVEWIVTFVKSIKKDVGTKFILGDIKNMHYTYDGQQFWEKAYTLLEVMPKLVKIQ